MNDKKEPTLAEEAGLPSSFHPIESAPIIPSAPPQPNLRASFFAGPISPSLQHDVDYVKTRGSNPSIPALPLMPAAPSGLPQNNSAIQSFIKPAAAAAVSTVGLVWKGQWSSAASYKQYDVVQFNSSTYMALNSSSSAEPDSNPTNWILLSENFVYKGQWTQISGIGVAQQPYLNYYDGAVEQDTVSSFAYIRSNAFPAWAANSTYGVGYRIVDSNGNLQIVTTAGKTKSGLHPVWNVTTGGTTVDNTLTWTNNGTANIISIGDTLLVFVVNSGLVGATGLTDSLGNIWTPVSVPFTFVGSIVATVASTSQLWRTTSIGAVASGSSYTTTASFASSIDLFVMATIGATGANFITEISKSGTSITPGPGSITTTANSLLVTWITQTQHTAGTDSLDGFTNIGTKAFTNGGTFGDANLMYLIAGAGTYNPVLGQSTGNYNFAAQMVEFNALVNQVYYPYDVVEYLGSTYVCIAQTATVPTDVVHWVLLAQGTGSVNVLSASYALMPIDAGKLIVNTTSSAYTATLLNPPPTNAWYAIFQQTGTGTLIISPNGLALDGSFTSLTLNQNEGVWVFSDGINYFTERGGPGAFLPLAGGTLTGALLFSPDNTYAIGASGATRPSIVYAGTSMLAPIFNAGTGFQIGGAAATAGHVLRANGTDYVDAQLNYSDLGGSNPADPAGSGSEVQYRSSGTAFGAVTGSSVSGGVITLAGGLLFTDNTYDIGASGATRPRTGYFGTSVLAPLFNAGTGFQIGGAAATAGHVLRANGTDYVDAVLAASDLSNGTTGTSGGKVVLQDAPTFTGVPIAVGFQIGGDQEVTGGAATCLDIIDTHGGAATPNKYLRTKGGHFQIVNSGFSNVIYDMDDSGNVVETTATLTAATPTGTGTEVGFGTTTGFGSGLVPTAVTTMLQAGGGGPTTPQTVVNFLEIDIGGSKYWLPLMQ